MYGAAARACRVIAFYAALLAAALAFTGCEQPGGTWTGNLQPDANARLKSLSVSAGYLTPAFNAETTAYRVTVNHAVDSITAAAVPAGAGASARVSGEMPRRLEVGDNPSIDIEVTAEDGTKEIYSIAVQRLDGSTVSVNSAEDLAKIGIDEQYPLAGNYRLAGDIELENWTPLGGDGLDPDGEGGNPQNPGPFTGSFDGGGGTITIKNFNAAVFEDHGSSGVYLGVFAYTRGNGAIKAVIKDLTVRTELNHTISKSGDCYIGALVGWADEYTELANITVEGSLSFSNDGAAAPGRPVCVGGVAGVLIASELKNSRVNADITGFGKGANGVYNYVGGMAGMFDRNAVTRGLNSAPAGTIFAGSSITNCRVTGNVSGSTAGDRANIFAGGIAGGAWYGAKTYYSGRIEDCSFTGTVSARDGGYWSWAGGIAGTICGDGKDASGAQGDGFSAAGPTRIVRCYAEGVITAGGPPGSWTCAGGITGYNYYGGLVSGCWFDGTVTAEGTGINDYTGGIAGCNSKQYDGHSSKIEDCWSAGTVQGNLNAGGIVGQNQVAAVIERCYSRASIGVRAAKDAAGRSSQQGAGGIAGYNAVMDGRAAGTVQGCAALNEEITSSGGFDRVYRVAGDGGGILENNLAWADMPVSISGSPSPNADPGGSAKDGADCADKPDQAAYQSLGWDFTTVWKMDESGYPALRWQH
jgi:hypothetical protein